MRRVAILCLALLAGSACDVSSSSAPATRQGQAMLPHFIGLRTHKGMSAFERGEQLAAEIRTLDEQSPTFRDLVGTLESVPGLKALVEPAPDNTAQQFRRGRTVLRPSPASFAAWMQLPVDPDDRAASVSAIARQFALVTEVACVGHYRTVHELQVAIGERSGLDAFGDLPDTPFADAAERVVVRESQHPSESETQFDALARQFDLRMCRDGKRPFNR